MIAPPGPLIELRYSGVVLAVVLRGAHVCPVLEMHAS